MRKRGEIPHRLSLFFCHSGIIAQTTRKNYFLLGMELHIFNIDEWISIQNLDDDPKLGWKIHAPRSNENNSILRITTGSIVVSIVQYFVSTHGTLSKAEKALQFNFEFCSIWIICVLIVLSNSRDILNIPLFQHDFHHLKC